MANFTASVPRSARGSLMATFLPPRVRRVDWINPIVLAVLAVTGIFFIKSAQSVGLGKGIPQWGQQLVWLALGAGLYCVVATLDYHVWMKNVWLVYGLGIALLLLLWSPLGEVRSGARRWLGIGSYTIQPSEFAIIGVIIMLSFVLAKSELGTLRDSLAMLGKVALIVAVPMVLIFSQPDLGSSLALFPTVFALLYVSNLSARFFITVCALFLAGLLVLKADTRRYEDFVQTRQVLEGKVSVNDYDDYLQNKHPGVISPLVAQAREYLLGREARDAFENYLALSNQTFDADLDAAGQTAFWQNYFAALQPYYISGLGPQEIQVLESAMTAQTLEKRAAKVLPDAVTANDYNAKFLQPNHLTVQDRIGTYQKRSWLPLKDYQRDRVASFLDPADVDPQGIGVTWNQKQSEIAVGTGGLTGKGYANGTQARLGYLPPKVATSDFIVAVFLEETGFIGGLALIGLYAILLGNTLRIAWLARDRFGRLLCVGVAVLFMVHVFVNIGMVQGLMPVKGMPLPLLSYGGSFVLGCCILMGLVQSVHRYSREAV